MKKKGSICDYIKSRNENLRREVDSRRRHHRNVVALFKAVAAEAKADRFYINEERAYAILKRELEEEAGKLSSSIPRPTSRMHRAMMAEIRRRVELLMEKDPRLSLRDAVYAVVNSPAPAFYLTPFSIRTIYYTAS